MLFRSIQSKYGCLGGVGFASAALQLADRGYVLETGQIFLSGTAQELLDNQDVQRAYLGKDYKRIDE